jgi:hypothetical protein
MKNKVTKTVKPCEIVHKNGIRLRPGQTYTEYEKVEEKKASKKDGE